MKIIKACLGFILLALSFPTKAQLITDASPFVLRVNQLKSWTPTSLTATAANISTVPLNTSFAEKITQLDSSLSHDMRVIYAPDGMNNFGNYLSEQNQFNLYNFTHWQYIDKLIWFGGTADQTVLIPAAPWVNAAHQNGVKVYGNVFFAPNAFGGSTSTVSDFLEKDGNGNFIAAQKLRDIVDYYGFDGWFINMETNTNSTNGQLMLDFVKELKRILPDDKEVIWYDSMLPNGNIAWQNQLNNNNSIFLQDGATRVSDGMFINFFWSGNGGPNTSKNTAQNLPRSEFDVYTGVDLWPDRNQQPFDAGGNGWMGNLHANNTPTTSLALFVPDVIFRNDRYSNFREDINQADEFYSAEKWLFAGEDRNPAISDASGFKGLSNWIPSTSVINTIPFETDFNTGHGQSKYSVGTEISTEDWHNLNEQDILPTWQFAFEGNSDLSARFIFDDAYNGGSSIEVTGNLADTDSTVMKLYKTNLSITAETQLEFVYKTGTIGATYMSLLATFADNPSTPIKFELGNSTEASWNIHTVDLSAQAGKELIAVGIEFASTTPVNNYTAKFGKLRIYNGVSTAPVANFAASVLTITEGQAVEFTDLSTNSPTSWEWTFEGGTPGSSTAQNPNITYNTIGTFQVSLKATNSDGNHTESKTGFITVVPDPITSCFFCSPQNNDPEIVLYPNPSTNKIQLSSEIPNDTKIEILNALGQSVYQGSVPADHLIEMHFLSNGNYYIRFLDGAFVGKTVGFLINK